MTTGSRPRSKWASRSSVWPPHAADCPRRHWGLRMMDERGEHGELASELTPTLVNAGAIVSAAEQEELRALLEATR